MVKQGTVLLGQEIPTTVIKMAAPHSAVSKSVSYEHTRVRRHTCAHTHEKKQKPRGRF